MSIPLNDVDVGCIHMSREEVTHTILHIEVNVLCRRHSLVELGFVCTLLHVSASLILSVLVEVLR